MADEHVEETSAEDEQSNGAEQSNGGHSNGHNIGRMAVIAAASGATAYAAKRALGSKSSANDGEGKRQSGGSQGSGASVVSAAVSTGWDVAKDSLLPVIEDAATRAGALVAERAPEVVRDVVVPRFVAGFERARRSKRDDESDE
jgi:hypothetical protein